MKEAASNKPHKINQKQLVKIFKDIKRLRSDENRFCFLIGAGASKSSGIDTGWELSKKWHQDLKDDLEPRELKIWEERIQFDADRIGEFYPFLYKKRYEALPQIGYDEFKRMMESAEPNIGYVILSQILAEEKHNFVITTNFDYLIEDAIRAFTSEKPFSAGHETLAEFISLQTERPTIIKVHRDLLLHPFNDEEKTQELKKEWKKALSPILKNFSLLVIGYGGNDGSLMDYLKDINYTDRKPIYWCIKDEHKLNKKVTNLLTNKDYLVTINGFDELMHSLYSVLDYKIFEDQGDIANHQFVKIAIRKITKLYENVEKLLQKSKENADLKILKDKQKVTYNTMGILVQILFEDDPIKKVEIYKAGIEKYPNNTALLSDYASFLARGNQYKQAEKYFQKAIKLEPNDQEIIYNWGNALGRLASMKVGSDADVYYNKAFGKFQEVIELNPDYFDAYANWGIFLGDLANSKKGTEAEELFIKSFEKFRRATEIKHNFYEAKGNWAVYLGEYARLKSGKKAASLYKDAFKLFDESTKINANDFQAYYNWGNTLAEFARTVGGREADNLYIKAFRKLQKAAEINPDMHQAYYNWGIFLEEYTNNKQVKIANKFHKQSIEKFQKAIDIKPDKHEAYYNWGLVLFKLAEQEKGAKAEKYYYQAIDKYQLAIKIKPKYPKALTELGKSYFKIGKTKQGKIKDDLYLKAIENLKAGSELGGEYYNLSCLYAILNDNKNAIKYLDKSLNKHEIETEFVLQDQYWEDLLENATFLNTIKKHQKK